MKSDIRARIERLRQQMEPTQFPSVSILSYENGVYKLSCCLRKPRAQEIKVESEHDTRVAAHQAYNDFLMKYPHSNHYEPVLIDIVLPVEEEIKKG